MTSNTLLYTAEQQLKVKRLLTFTITATANTAFTFRLCQTDVNGIARIKWGDGMEEAVPYNGAGYGQRMSHTYEAAGTYQVSVYADTLRSFRFTSSAAALVASVDYWHKDLFTAPELFYVCYNTTFPTSLPDGVERIRYYAFYNAYSMSNISFPSSLRRIDDYAFDNAFEYQLSGVNVTFNGTPDYIGPRAFRECESIQAIYVPWSYGEVANAPWGAANAIIYYDTGKLPAGYTRGDAMRVPDSVISYIDTGLTHSTDDEWILNCCNSKTANSGIVGASESKTAGNFSLWLHGESGAAHNRVDFIFGNGSDINYQLQTTVDAVSNYHIYRMKLSTGEAWIDGVYVGKATSVGTVSVPKKLVFFGNWRGSAINGGAPNCRIKQYMIFRQGVLVRNYVPCTEDANEQAGMYDLCGSTLGDAGTPFYITNDGRGEIVNS